MASKKARHWVHRPDRDQCSGAGLCTAPAGGREKEGDTVGIGCKRPGSNPYQSPGKVAFLIREEMQDLMTTRHESGVILASIIRKRLTKRKLQ